MKSRLGRRPKRRAVDAVVQLLADSDAVAEIYAPDDALKVIIEEFVG